MSFKNFLLREAQWTKDTVKQTAINFAKKTKKFPHSKVSDEELAELTEKIYEKLQEKIKQLDINKVQYFVKVKRDDFLHLPFLVKFYFQLYGNDYDEKQVDMLLAKYEKYIKFPKLHNGNRKIDHFDDAKNFVVFVNNFNVIDHGDFNKEDLKQYENDDIVIYHGNSISACRAFGEGTELCTARTDASNLFYNYRFDKEGTIYYVFFKDKEKYAREAPHGFVDISIYPDETTINFANPNDDEKVSREKIIKMIPELNEKDEDGNVIYDKYLIPQPLTKEEHAIIDKISEHESILELETIEERLMFVELGNKIEDYEWEELENMEPILKKYIELLNYPLPEALKEKYPKLWERYSARVPYQTPKDAYNYAKSIGFQDVSEIAIKYISVDKDLCYDYAEEMDFGRDRPSVDDLDDDEYENRDPDEDDYENYIPDEIYDTISKHPRLCYKFALEFVGSSRVTGKKIFLPSPITHGLYSDADISFECANDLYFRNLPFGLEDAYGGLEGIAKDKKKSFIYASTVGITNVPNEVSAIYGGLEELTSNPNTALEFVRVNREVNNRRQLDPDIINAISKDTNTSMEYAKDLDFNGLPDEIIDGIGVDVISKDLELSYKIVIRNYLTKHASMFDKRIPDKIIATIATSKEKSIMFAKAWEEYGPRNPRIREREPLPEIIQKAIDS